MEPVRTGRSTAAITLKLGILIGIGVLLGVGILIGGNAAGEWLFVQIEPSLDPSAAPPLGGVIVSAMALYVVLMMLPFVPGVEIGLGLMVILGPKVAPLVYLCTVLALVLAFLIGRLVPQRTIVKIFEVLHLRRGATLLRRLEPLDAPDRLAFLLQHASTRMLPFLLRHRFVALFVALNFPGNALIGGGGGICLVAGFSRLFTFPRYAMTIAIAVLPVPLMMLLSSY